LSNLGEAAAEIARHRQIPLASLERELRGDLEWIPLKALRKDRAQRYRTAAEFSEDVRNYLEDKPLTAGPESAAYRARKFLRRNKGLVASVTTLSIILAGASAVSTWQAVRARRAEANAKLSQLEASRQRDQAIAEKQRADDQTETAKAVRDFLQEMLSAGASYRGLGENVTVLEAVRQAVKKLDEGALDAKPLVEGAVRLSVGETLVGIGRHDEAEPNLVKSLALRRSALPPGHPDVAMSLDRLGGMYKDLGLFDKAEPALREAIAIYRAQLPTREWDYSFTLTGLSWVLREQKHLDEAERLDREALAIRRRLRSPSGIAHALGALAKDLDAQGRLEEEEQVLRERFDLWRKVSPANAYAADQVWDLGSILRKRGKLDEANRLLNESLQTAGEDKTAVRASRLRSRAGLLRAMGRLDEAARDHRESLEIRLKELPKGHPIIAESLVSLAAALRDAGDTNGTVELMKGIGAQYLKDFAERRRGTKDTPDTAVTLILIGSSFEAAGFYEKAEELYRDGLKIRRHLLNEYHPQVAAVLSRLSQLLDRCGRRSEADALWQETVEQRLKKLGSDNAPAQCAAVYLSVVPAMLNADHLDQARAFCEEALGRGPTNLYYLNAVAWRLTVAAELHQRDPALAVKLADRAVALAPEDGAIRNTLGVALYRAGDFKRAATELRVSVRLNAAAPIVSDYLFLAMAYKRIGDEPSAREWYDKAVKMNVKTAQSEEVRQFRAEADATLALSPTAARAPAAAATDSAMQLAVPADVEALIGSGRLDAAEKRLLELHATLQGDARAAVRDRLMRLYAERGKFDDAIKIAAQRVASARKLYRPGHPRFPRVAQYRLDYAELLLQDRQFETAEHVLAEAERECLPDQRQEVTAAYVKLYEASGNREEAANWRAKLGIDAGAATRPHAAGTRPAGPPQ
jgi:tetratricopeptide (TPR) repeat protein